MLHFLSPRKRKCRKCSGVSVLTGNSCLGGITVLQMLATSKVY